MSTVKMILLVILSLATADAAETSRLVAPLKSQDAIDGCSWSASAASLGEKIIFLSEYDNSDTVMNIDGSDTHLKLVHSKGQLKKIGDALDMTFQASEVTVKAHYVVTWTCRKRDESCEVTKLAITFDVSKGARFETIKATGDVGC